MHIIAGVSVSAVRTYTNHYPIGAQCYRRRCIVTRSIPVFIRHFPELCLELFPTKELTIPDSQRTDEINGKPCNINDIISEK